MQLALQQYASGRLSDAERSCRQVLAAQPRQADALHLLGVLAHGAGYTADAIGLVEQAIASDPTAAAYRSNLGVFLTALGRFGPATRACRDAIALDAFLVDAHYNLGNASTGAGALDQAIGAYRRAIELRGDFVPAHNNLGNALKASGRLDEAIAAYRKALDFDPHYAQARSNLASVLKEVGRLDEALAEAQRAVATAPGSPAIHSNLIVALQYLGNDGTDPDAVDDEARRWDERFGHPPAGAIAPEADRTSDRPLAIGFVSPDLRLHSIAFFLLPLLEARDRTALHVTCYATGSQDDAVTQRLREASDRWYSLVGLSDVAAAQRIRDDGIDLLFDLSGHTAGNRLSLFAHRPAPVQVTYLGFPGTTGLRAMDFRMTDALADPLAGSVVGGEHPERERLFRLPASAWCFAPIGPTPDVAEAPVRQNGYPTFGNVGNLAKVSTPTLRLWGELLAQVPDARLALKSIAFRDRATRERFERTFAALGVSADRLQLMPDDPSLFEHLRSYARIDLVLDTFPFNGLTTTCQALWMGVPVVTLAGVRQAARMGASVLTNLGLESLVADTPSAYLRIAAGLAADRSRLIELRTGMRARLQRSALGDAKRFAADMATACGDMWRDRR